MIKCDEELKTPAVTKPDEDEKMIYVRMKDLREDADLTQQKIAGLLHIKQNTYSQYENGQRQIPLELLVALARFYGVSVDYILGLTDVKRPYKRS